MSSDGTLEQCTLIPVVVIPTMEDKKGDVKTSRAVNPTQPSSNQSGRGRTWFLQPFGPGEVMQWAVLSAEYCCWVWHLYFCIPRKTRTTLDHSFKKADRYSQWKQKKRHKQTPSPLTAPSIYLVKYYIADFLLAILPVRIHRSYLKCDCRKEFERCKPVY